MAERSAITLHTTNFRATTGAACVQTEREFAVKADIPGVNKDQVKVYQDGDVLSISAETKQVYARVLLLIFPFEATLARFELSL